MPLVNCRKSSANKSGRESLRTKKTGDFQSGEGAAAILKSPGTRQDVVGTREKAIDEYFVVFDGHLIATRVILQYCNIVILPATMHFLISYKLKCTIFHVICRMQLRYCVVKSI